MMNFEDCNADKLSCVVLSLRVVKGEMLNPVKDTDHPIDTTGVATSLATDGNQGQCQIQDQCLSTEMDCPQTLDAYMDNERQLLQVPQQFVFNRTVSETETLASCFDGMYVDESDMVLQSFLTSDDLQADSIAASAMESSSAVSGGNVYYDSDGNWMQDSDGDTLLHNAIIANEPDKAIKYIENCPSNDYINIPNNEYQRPIHLCAVLDQQRVTDKLVAMGADIEVRDKSGNTPVHISCARGNVDMVKRILSINDKVEEKSMRKTMRYKKNVSRHVTFNFDLRNCEGQACIHLAAAGGHLAIIRLLVENGANVNARELKTGRTVLHEAARTGQTDFALFLMQLPGCNMNARAYDGITPYDLARSHGRWEVAMQISARGGKAAASLPFDEDE